MKNVVSFIMVLALIFSLSIGYAYGQTEETPSGDFEISITADKAVSWYDASFSDKGMGGTVKFTITVENTGTEPINNINVVAEDLGINTTINTLYTTSVVTASRDMTALGTYTQKAAASCGEIEKNATCSVDVRKPYEIEISQTAAPSEVKVGDEVTFKIKVKNTGCLSISSKDKLKVTDEKTSPSEWTLADAGLNSLARDESAEFSGTAKMSQSGSFNNVVTAEVIVCAPDVEPWNGWCSAATASSILTLDIKDDSNKDTIHHHDDKDSTFLTSEVTVPDKETPYLAPAAPAAPKEPAEGSSDIMVLDHSMAYALPTLPQTGGMGLELLYGISALAFGASILYKKRK